MKADKDPNQNRSKEKKAVAIKPLPPDLVMEILSWAPFKTLQRFKCVCKLWFSLFTNNPYFGKLHCKRVLVELVRKYDNNMRGFRDLVLKYDNKMRDFSVSPCEGDFLEEVYQCFYKDHRTYTLQDFVRLMNASGFLQYPLGRNHSNRVSFCNWHYVLDSLKPFWFDHFWLDHFGLDHLRMYESVVLDNDPTLVLVPTIEAARIFLWASPFRRQHVCVDKYSILEGRLSLVSGDKIVVCTADIVSKFLSGNLLLHDCVKKFVLYKADELFARGFKHEIYNILKLLSWKVKVIINCQRIPREALEIPRLFLNKKVLRWETSMEAVLETLIINISKTSKDLSKAKRLTERELVKLHPELCKTYNGIIKEKDNLKKELLERSYNEKKSVKMQSIEKWKSRSRISWNHRSKMCK